MQSNKVYFLIIAVLTVFIFWQKGIFQFLQAENLAGRDLIGNYAFAWLMQEFMKDLSFSGLNNLWFAGFPAFDFYPPLFFITVNLLNFLSFGFIGLEISYKIIIFLSLFVFPSVVYFSFERMGFNKLESLFASIFFFVLAAITTFAPSLARSIAIDFPIPLLPPVTMATLPFI